MAQKWGFQKVKQGGLHSTRHILVMYTIKEPIKYHLKKMKVQYY